MRFVGAKRVTYYQEHLDADDDFDSMRKISTCNVPEDEMWDFEENEVSFTWSAAFDTNTLITHEISPFDENSCFVVIEEATSEEECDDNPLVETSSSSTTDGQQKKSIPARPTVRTFASRFRKSFQSLKKGLSKRISRSNNHLESQPMNDSQSSSGDRRHPLAHQSLEQNSHLQVHLKNTSITRTEKIIQKQTKLSRLRRKFHLGTQKQMTNISENDRQSKSQSSNSRSHSTNEEELVETGSSESSLVMDNNVIQFSIPGQDLYWC